MLRPVEITQLATELYCAETSGGSVDLFTARYPELTWDDARAIARRRDELRRNAGETFIGYKLGWTSAAMREALGIDRPNWGTLWASQFTGEDGSAVMVTRLRHPKLEPEIVHVVGADLPGADTTAGDVLAADGSWTIGLEVVNPRFPDYHFDWLDNTADNSSAQAVAHSRFRKIEGDPSEIEVTLTAGDHVATGTGAQAMGSPAEAVAWLARALAEEETILRQGDRVFTGGLTPPVDVVEGHDYQVRSPGFERLRLKARDYQGG